MNIDVPNMPSLADYLPLDTIFGKGGQDPELHMVEADDPSSFLQGYKDLFSWLATRLSFWYRDKYSRPSFFIWRPESSIWKYCLDEERWRYDGEWFMSRLLQDGWNFKLQMAVMVGIQ